MKVYRKILALFLVTGIQIYAGPNRSDLWTSGASDAWQDPEDSFDELRGHNHSVDGDNLDWKAYHIDDHEHVHCRNCAANNAKKQRIAYGYAYRKYTN